VHLLPILASDQVLQVRTFLCVSRERVFFRDDNGHRREVEVMVPTATPPDYRVEKVVREGPQHNPGNPALGICPHCQYTLKGG